MMYEVFEYLKSRIWKLLEHFNYTEILDAVVVREIKIFKQNTVK